jgi:hypothetical protein
MNIASAKPTREGRAARSSLALFLLLSQPRALASPSSSPLSCSLPPSPPLLRSVHNSLSVYACQVSRWEGVALRGPACVPASCPLPSGGLSVVCDSAMSLNPVPGGRPRAGGVRTAGG